MSYHLVAGVAPSGDSLIPSGGRANFGSRSGGAVKLADGRVCIVGGFTPVDSGDPLYPDWYDSDTVFVSTDATCTAWETYHDGSVEEPMPDGNGDLGHCDAVLMDVAGDGDILIASRDASGVIYRFNPDTGVFTDVTDSGIDGSSRRMLCQLTDGRVLLVNEQSTSGKQSRIFDPSDNTWSAGPDLEAATSHASGALVALPDGGAVWIGGTDGSTAQDKILRLASDLSAWSDVATMATGRLLPGVVTLPDGSLLIIGGFGFDPQTSCEIYDPDDDSLTAAGSLNVPRGECGAVLLPGGETVMIAGGFGGDDGFALDSIELYSIDDDEWTVDSNTLSEARGHPTIALIDDAPKVYIFGGEVYLVDEDSLGETAQVWGNIQPTIGVWTRGTFPSGLGTVRHVWGFASDDLYVIGESKFIHWNGSSWEELPAPPFTLAETTGLWGASNAALWVTDGDTLYKSVDQGDNWTTELTGADFVSPAIWGASASDFWLRRSDATEGDTIALSHTTNGGTSFTDYLAGADLDGQVTNGLPFGLAADDVYIPGGNVIVHWNGSALSATAATPAGSGTNWRIWGPSSAELYLWVQYNKSIYRSTDGFATLALDYDGGDGGANDVWGADGLHIYGGGNYTTNKSQILIRFDADDWRDETMSDDVTPAFGSWSMWAPASGDWAFAHAGGYPWFRSGLALVSIAVTPADQAIGETDTQQYTATGTYSDSSTADITDSVVWSSTNTSAATISGGGLATGVAPGTTTIRATLGDVEGETDLTVNDAPIPLMSAPRGGAKIGLLD